jgi:hypothetical protein
VQQNEARRASLILRCERLVTARGVLDQQNVVQNHQVWGRKIPMEIDRRRDRAGRKMWSRLCVRSKIGARVVWNDRSFHNHARAGALHSEMTTARRNSGLVCHCDSFRDGVGLSLAAPVCRGDRFQLPRAMQFSAKVFLLSPRANAHSQRRAAEHSERQRSPNEVTAKCCTKRMHRLTSREKCRRLILFRRGARFKRHSAICQADRFLRFCL